jgi:acetolactate synthase-1/2/3 large subunit
MTKMTGARYIAETLEGHGVSHVFLVPTILSQALTEMEERTNITRIVTHGEKSAVYMADGYARASGKPGICMAQTVGAANLAAGLRDPFLANTPMIAFSGGAHPWSRNRMQYQQIEDFPLFKPVTKSSEHVDDISMLPLVLRQAFRTATTGTPGPAHIQLVGHAGDIELEELDTEILIEDRFSQVPAFRPVGDPDDIQAVARILESAERPIIVAGGGVAQSGAGPEVLELAERLQIPVAVSLNAKAVIPGQHPLAVGMPGIYSRKSANRAVMEADLVFFVGSQAGSQVTNNWRIPALGTRVVQLDINAENLGRHYPNEASILGDAKITLRELITAVDGGTASKRQAWVARAHELVEEWRAEFSELMSSDTEPMRPERLCAELTDLLPTDAMLVADTGHAGMWTGGMMDLKHEDQTYIRAGGSLGWGFPATLGAKLALPDRPVVLWTGDGGLWYHLSELETAARWNINAVIVVNNNHALNQEIGPYTRSYGGTLHGRHAELWHFEEVDFAQIAKEMGADGVRVTKPSQLESALAQGVASKGPFVVDVVTEIMATAPLSFMYDEKNPAPTH